MNTLARVSARSYRVDETSAPTLACEAKSAEFLEVKVEVSVDASADAHTDGVILDAFLSRSWVALRRLTIEQGLAIRVSITATSGYVTTPKLAHRQAVDDNVSWLEESAENLAYMRERIGTQRSTPLALARMIVDMDSVPELHDEVTTPRGADRCLISTGGGCLHSEIRDWHGPKYAAVIRDHLCNMRPGAPDQEKAIRLESRRRRAARAKGDYGPIWTGHDDQKNFLATIGLAESKFDGEILVTGRGVIPARGYAYGSGWVASMTSDETLEIALSMREASEASERAA